MTYPKGYGKKEEDYFGQKQPEKASRWWFLLPLFLGVIGGIIGMIALWNKDRETAKMVLIMGFVFGLLWGIALFVVVVSTYDPSGGPLNIRGYYYV